LHSQLSGWKGSPFHLWSFFFDYSTIVKRFFVSTKSMLHLLPSCLLLVPLKKLAIKYFLHIFFYIFFAIDSIYLISQNYEHSNHV
jgi:hypothetical protein